MFSRVLIGLVVVPVALAVPHHGAYSDPKHYVSSDSWAGLRFIAEGPPHVLTLTGTDDGQRWFTLKGTCSGSGMSVITFDFSPKGGPSNAVGTASVLSNGEAVITWPDGNVWTRVTAPGNVPKLANKVG